MRLRTLVVGIMNQSGAKETDFVTVCVASGESPQQLWFGNFGPQVKGSVRVNIERQAVKILCAAGGLNNQAHGYNHR